MGTVTAPSLTLPRRGRAPGSGGRLGGGRNPAHDGHLSRPCGCAAPRRNEHTVVPGRAAPSQTLPRVGEWGNRVSPFPSSRAYVHVRCPWSRPTTPDEHGGVGEPGSPIFTLDYADRRRATRWPRRAARPGVAHGSLRAFERDVSNFFHRPGARLSIAYREGSALPPQAVIGVMLEDISRADAPATIRWEGLRGAALAQGMGKPGFPIPPPAGRVWEGAAPAAGLTTHTPACTTGGTPEAGPAPPGHSGAPVRCRSAPPGHCRSSAGQSRRSA